MTQLKHSDLNTSQVPSEEAASLEKRAAWHLHNAGLNGIGLADYQFHLSATEQIAELMGNQYETRATSLNLLGRVALERGHTRQAQQYLEAAVHLAPVDAGIRFSLGHLALMRQRLSEAASEFRAAMTLDPDATIADQSLAYVKYRSGLFAEAFSDYRHLIRKYPDQWLLKTRLLECASRVKADYDDPALSRDLVTLLATPNLDHQNLATLTGSLLIHRYRLSDPGARIELDRLINDPLLCAALPQMLFVHPEMDELLANLRQTLFHHFLNQGTFDGTLDPLLSGMAWHGLHSEFVLPETPEETETITNLVTYCADLHRQKQYSNLALPTVLLALYRPLSEVLSELKPERLARHLPSCYLPVLKEHIVEVAAECTRAASIKALTPVNEQTSQAVRAQYEENPYPRWKYLPRYASSHYLQAVAAEIPAYQVPEDADSKTASGLKVLVAGTGTGRHAIHLARHFYDTDVTAIDLSRRSLAYGEGMAESLGLDNIRFLQADILELPNSPSQRFDVIECSGVLHHMTDPVAGWEKLCAQLNPGGLMKVGLYSTRARAVIHRLRTVIADHNLTPTPADIRRFRHSLLQPPRTDDLAPLIQSADFYSMSGVRDLLFHVQEHTFTPAELAEMVEDLPLQFLGFVLTPPARRSYQHFFPSDPLMNDLGNWERLEQDNPNLFTGMYQMYLQKKP